MRQSILLAIALLYASVIAGHADEQADSVEKRFDSLISAFLARDGAIVDSSAFREMYLTAQTGSFEDRTALLRQVLRRTSQDKSERQIGTYALTHWLGFSPKEKALVCCEYLFDKDDEMRSVCRRVLQVDVLRMHALRRGSDFSILREALSLDGGDRIKDTAIRYMFQRDPSAAFDTMGSIDTGSKDILQLYVLKDEAELAIAKYRLAPHDDPNGDRLRDTVSGALREVAKQKPWWCKLYVAETLARNQPFLRHVEAFPEIADEKHPYVVEALKHPFDEDIIHYRVKVSNTKR